MIIEVDMVFHEACAMGGVFSVPPLPVFGKSCLHNSASCSLDG